MNRSYQTITLMQVLSYLADIHTNIRFSDSYGNVSLAHAKTHCLNDFVSDFTLSFEYSYEKLQLIKIEDPFINYKHSKTETLLYMCYLLI